VVNDPDELVTTGVKMMTILDSKVGSAYFGILLHMLIVIAH